MGFLINSFSVIPAVLPDPTIPTISDQILWLKSSDGITKDGSDKVSAWADQSGTGNNLVEATGSKQPLWVDNQLGGYPSVQFDGTNDRLVKAWAGGTKSQPITYCIVAEWASGGGYIKGGTSGTRNFIIDGGTSFNNGATTDLSGGTIPSGYFDSVHEFNGTSSEIWVNGSSVLAGNTGTSGTTGISLAARYNDSNHGDPKIVEFIVYNKVLTSGELADLTAYFVERYSL